MCSNKRHFSCQNEVRWSVGLPPPPETDVHWTHTPPLNQLRCVVVRQGCCRDGPPLRTLWTRWCLSSTPTLRPSSWTLKAEKLETDLKKTERALIRPQQDLFSLSIFTLWMDCLCFIYCWSLLKSHWLIWYIWLILQVNNLLKTPDSV